MKRLIVLALIISALSSAAFAGTMSGYVLDQNGNPIVGARVFNFKETGAGTDVYTDATGYYSVAGIDDDGNSSGFHVYKDGYTMPVRWQDDGNVGTITQNWTLRRVEQFSSVSDDFNSGSWSGRTTQGAEQFYWGTAGATPTLSGGNVNLVGGNEIVINDGVEGGNFAPGDFIAEFRFRPSQTAQTRFTFNYRLPTSSPVPDYHLGEAVYFLKGSGEILGNAYDYNPAPRVYRGASTIDWSVFHTVTLKVVGYRAQLWWDGVMISDGYNNGANVTGNAYSRGGREVAYTPGAPDYANSVGLTGFVGLQMFEGSLELDYFNVTAVPEPGSIVALLAGMTGLVGFARRRRA